MRDYYIYSILQYGPDEWIDDIKTSGTGYFDQIVLKSFRDALKNITENYAGDPGKQLIRRILIYGVLIEAVILL